MVARTATVVLPARDEVSRVLTGGRTTIAVRVPDQEQARAVIARFGRAVALTSANAHGEPEARSAEEVAATFGVQSRPSWMANFPHWRALHHRGAR